MREAAPPHRPLAHLSPVRPPQGLLLPLRLQPGSLGATYQLQPPVSLSCKPFAGPLVRSPLSCPPGGIAGQERDTYYQRVLVLGETRQQETCLALKGVAVGLGLCVIPCGPSALLNKYRLEPCSRSWKGNLLISALPSPSCKEGGQPGLFAQECLCRVLA